MRWALLAVVMAVAVGCEKKSGPTESPGLVPKPGEPKASEGKSNALQSAPPEAPAKDVAIGEEIDCGDLKVKVTRVLIETFQSQGEFDRLEHRPELVVWIEIKNSNPNRVVPAMSQSERARARDDVGNELEQVKTTDESGRPTRVRGQIAAGGKYEVRSDEPWADKIVYKKPVPGASKVTIELDTGAYGKPGRIRLVIDRDGFERAKYKK